ncbi:MAG TPA: DNA-binding protein [Xanthobacteraceae bacterium]|nr:DNA-binding protein [Xanthobacteraceae bacterium]
MDPNIKSNADLSLADDMLSGAEEIAEYLFGDRRHRRKVYYLAECTKIPIFRLGSSLRARRSVLLNWIETQENA